MKAEYSKGIVTYVKNTVDEIEGSQTNKTGTSRLMTLSARNEGYLAPLYLWILLPIINLKLNRAVVARKNFGVDLRVICNLLHSLGVIIDVFHIFERNQSLKMC